MSEEPPQFSAFISYASADQAKAEEICFSLEARGLLCWIAPRDIRSGREYGDEIIRGIQQSRCLVLVLSEAANQSPFVRREVERAVSKRKPVFPIRIEEIVPSPSLELFVSATHWIDAWSGRLVDHVDRLARDLADDSVVEKATQVSKKIARRRQVPRWAVAAAAFAAVIIAIVVGNQLSRRLEQMPVTPQTTITFSVPPIKSFDEMENDAQQRLNQQLNQEIAKTISASGTQLKNIASPEGESAPPVYESLPSATGKLQFVPLCPPDTVTVKYSFDEGGYFELTPAEYPIPETPPFVIEEWEAGERLSLLLKKSDGREVGPFQYAVQERTSFILQQLKARFLADLPKALQCALIPFTIPVPVSSPPTPSPSVEVPADKSKKSFQEMMNDVKQKNHENSERAAAETSATVEADNRRIDIYVVLMEAGYPEVTKAPIVVCAPAKYSSVLGWAAVREVRIGTKSGALAQVIPVNINWDEFLKVGKGYFSEESATFKQWQALLPADTKSIYARFVFRDNSESAEVRYRVDTTSIYLPTSN